MRTLLLLAIAVQLTNAQGVRTGAQAGSTLHDPTALHPSTPATPASAQISDIVLSEKSGGTVRQYVAKLEAGVVLVDANRRVTGLTGIIRYMETPGQKSMPVMKGQVRDGSLLLTMADGAVYSVYEMTSPSTGSIRLEKPARAVNRR